MSDDNGVPLPQASPRPPEFVDSDSGVRRALVAQEKKPKKERIATNGDVRKYLGIAVGVLTFITSGGVFAGAQWVVSSAEAKSKQTVDAGLDVERESRKELARKLDEHIADEMQARRQQAEREHNTQLDLRALYRFNRTGERQERLETPPPRPLASTDGGR
jgi:hypothetical protein